MNGHLLAQGRAGELLLIVVKGDNSRTQLIAKENRIAELFTFPTVVDNRLFVRRESEVLPVDL